MLPVQILNVIVVEEEQHRENIRQHNIERRVMRDDADPFNLSEIKFRQLFRLTKEMVRYITTELGPHLHRNSALAISQQQRILAGLYFFATGSYQRTVGQSWNLSMSQQAVSKCVHEVSELIVAHLANHWIKFPTTQEELNSVKSEFMRKTRFPGVIGAIDCTHVAIIAPSMEEHNYFNRKGYHSKNVQIVCNFDLTITNVNSRYGGAAHDSFIWRNSILHEELQRRHNVEGDRQSWLLGDSGYPQQPWLMTPVLHAQEGTAEFAYNARHMSARNCVERCNGVLKGRFRCLLAERKLRYKPRKVNNIIVSCVVLHNICIAGKLENNYPALIADNNIEIPAANDGAVGQGNCGFQARERLINRYFNR